jgi:hypothetical protein
MMNIRVAIVLVLVAGCSSDPKEQPPADAAVAIDGRECTGEAGQFDQCTGDKICIASRCEPAFPRTYALTMITATMPASNVGANWDGSGNMPGNEPDTYVTFSVNGTQQARTPTQTDSYNVSYVGPFTLTLTKDSELITRLWDDDGGNDALAKVCVTILTAADLRARNDYICAEAGNSPGASKFHLEPVL